MEKSISPAYKMTDGRTRLTGYIGQVTDETGLVLHSQEYGSYREAEIKINALVRELLIDYCEQGLVDELPAFDGSAAAPGGILVVLVDAMDDKPGGIDDAPPEPPVYPQPNGRSPFCATCDGAKVIYYDSVLFDVCATCNGSGTAAPSLLTDVHSVLSQCLSNQRMVAIVPEIERVLHRVEQALCVELMATA